MIKEIILTLNFLLMVSPYLGSCDEKPNIAFLYGAYGKEIKALESTRMRRVGALNARAAKQVCYYLYVKEYDSFDLLHINNTDSLTKSHFKGTRPTKVLIHGWMDFVHGDMITTVKDAFLKGPEDVNILVIDWGDFADDINYFKVAERVDSIGQQVAEMVAFILANCPEAKMQDFHIIGHSLGAHVAGAAARRLPSVPRVTGLDPAGPGFAGLEVVGPRITKSDAEFVDCIHTCGLTLGVFDADCTADFYPNGGRFNQPGCNPLDFGKCSHYRSFEFFAVSIDPTYSFPVEACDKASISNWNCKNSSYLMGYPVQTTARGPFYTTTSKKYPYVNN